MITLVLESSTYAGSAALLVDATLLAERAVTMRGKEREALMAAVSELYAEAGVQPGDTRRVVCGSGPGSFTSLRIAGGIAKGIALAARAELRPVSSLALLAASREPRVDGRVLAVVDAMRDECYAAAFEQIGGRLQPLSQVSLVSKRAVVADGARWNARVIGPDQPDACRTIPRASAAVYITNMIDEVEAANLATWEPAYGRLAEAQVKWEADNGRALRA